MSTDLVIERDDALTELVAHIAQEHTTPGLAVGVLVDGRALVATAGVTSTTDPLPVDDTTLFMVGSTSKTFTATALMALVDRGAVSLQDPVAAHVPALRLQDPDVAATVTVRRLLDHTSGWRGDLNPDTGWGEDALARALEALAEAPQENPPGAVVSYSNSALMLAGHLVAAVHGTTFEVAVRELVLEPLGLTDSCFLPWEMALRRAAVGHVLRPDGPTPLPVFPTVRATGPVGGLWSSVRDQLRWAAYHLDGRTSGTAPLREETRLLMQQPSATARSTITGVGLSWLLKQHGDVRLVTHGGNVSNLQTSTFALAPDHGAAVTVLTNAKHGTAIGTQVEAWLLQDRLGLPAPAPLPTVPFDPADYTGRYDMGPFAWSLTQDADRLQIQMVLPDDVGEDLRVAFSNAPRDLVAVERDLFALASDPATPALEVRRDAHGAVEGVVHGLRFARRLP